MASADNYDPDACVNNNLCQWACGIPSKLDTPEGTYDMCLLIKADFTNAVDYRFVFVSQLDGTVVTYNQGAPNTYRLVRQIEGLEVGITYDVTVDAAYLCNGEDPEYIIGFESTSITFEPQEVGLNPLDECSVTGSRYLGDYISATPYVCTGVMWEWTFSREGELPIVFVRNTSNRFLRLSDVQGLLPGQTYQVTMRAGYPNGSFTPISHPGCIKIIGEAPGSAIAMEDPTDQEASERNAAETAVSTQCYPNPNTGETLHVVCRNLDSSAVIVELVSLSGERILVHPIQAENGAIHARISCRGLDRGLYAVRVHTGNSVESDLIVIE